MGKEKLHLTKDFKGIFLTRRYEREELRFFFDEECTGIVYGLKDWLEICEKEKADHFLLFDMGESDYELD